MIETDDDIATEASVVDIDGTGPVIFFASGDFVYAVESDGTSFGNWLMYIDAEVSRSIGFGLIAPYSQPLVIFGDDNGQIHIYTIDGESYNDFAIDYSFPFKGAPTILDTDGDGDLEIILGTTQNITNIDIKQPGTVEGLWNTHRANMSRTGFYSANSTSEELVGDINNDSSVNIYDIIMLVNYILENSYNPLGDLNGDGMLSIYDIVMLINIIFN